MSAEAHADQLRGHDRPLGRRLEADAVVVGAGPGGAAVVRQLTAAGLRVILLEDGPPRSRFRPSFRHVSKYHMQEGGTMVAMGPTPFPVMAGRGVGGGSLVNSAICFRAPDTVLSEWSEMLADERFSPQQIHPVYEEIENRIGVAPVLEAFAGENNLLVARGVAALGLEGGLLQRNAPGCVGCGICNLGCPTGGKGSMDRNLIADALEKGLLVQADCRVERLLDTGDRVVGVKGRLRSPDDGSDHGEVEVRAPIVVLSAGALGTPRLLHLDGLADELGPVGAQLHLHPGSGVLGVCDHEVHMWRGVTQGAYAWDPSEPKVLPHTINIPPEALIAQSGQVGMEAKKLLHEINHIAGLGVMVSDKGKGSVGAYSNGRVRMSYRWDEEDIAVLRRGMVLSARILLAGGAREVFATAFGVGRHTNIQSFAEEMQSLPLGNMTLYSAHPMSTCLMGADPRTSVVNPRGRTHQRAGLYIADAGVFPTSLGVNPQLTTMAIGTLIGQSIVEDET